MFDSILAWLGFSKPKPAEPLRPEGRAFLDQNVAFYTNLSADQKLLFEQRCLLFLHSTDILGNGFDPSLEDRLLVASGSVILAWGFDRWHYVRVDEVILVEGSFNEHSEFGEGDSNIQGLVGSHHLAGKMILSRPALHAGFSNDRDKQNVALHEFAHLIDMADGKADGFPEQLAEYSFSVPWLALVSDKIKEINSGDSNIRDYGATNNAEFFAVASEYFFERPKMLRDKHPKLYAALTKFYKQDLAELSKELQPRKKQACPCGSGKRYKRCCLPH